MSGAGSRTATIREIAARSAWLLDRDGTLTLGDRTLPHVARFLSALRSAGRSFWVTTNNSSRSPVRHHENLVRAGLDVRPDEVHVSIESALAWLAAQGITRLRLFANDEVAAWVRSRGFETLEAGAPSAQAAVLAYDTDMTYTKLVELTQLVRAGRPWIATHLDWLCPTPDGPVPDIGTMIDAVFRATGRMPLRTFGKPDASFVEPLLASRGFGFGDAVVVGDRLYTDVATARGTGIRSVLVLTGETTRAMHDASEVRADLVVEDLGELADAILAS